MTKLVFIFCLACVACNISQEKESLKLQRLDLGDISIEVPRAWRYTPVLGISAGFLEVQEGEKVSINYGPYCNNLHTDPSTHDINFALVDDKGAKIVRPKISGDGFTGIYFENIKNGNTTDFKLLIVGLNVSPDTEQSLLRAFKTLTFEQSEYVQPQPVSFIAD
ncbi:hypothetical protein [Pseudochryseolinea flava]|nr:hypothetical protein [Pseudochryseolinea flava]